MKFRPYISIDAETTGLDTEKSQIIEFAAVYDDLLRPVAELPYFHCLVHYPHIDYGELQALAMNVETLKELGWPKKSKSKILPFEQFVDGLMDFVATNSKIIKDYEDSQFIEGRWTDYRVHLCGKAAPTFDWPLFLNQIKLRLSEERLAEEMAFIEKNIHFWIIDIGSMYVVDFMGKIPPMNDINQLLGRPKVSHKALEDARDNVCAVRHKVGIPF